LASRIVALRRTVLLACALAPATQAAAHVMDGVEVQRLGKEAAIIIRFNTQVQYLRHAPLARGKTLLIYLQRTGVRLPDEEFGPQTIRLPKTDLVPQFSATYPGPGGNTLQLDFSQSTEFSVHPAPDGRSIAVTVPVLAGATVMSVQVKAPPTAAPPAPAPAAPESRKQLVAGVDVQRRGKNAEISLRFAVPIRLLRHIPGDEGSSLRLYLEASEPQVRPPQGFREALRVPDNDLAPRLTVTYPETDGALLLAFDRSTRFTVSAAPDGRRIVVVVPSLPGARDFAVQLQSTPRNLVAIAPAAAPAAPAAAAIAAAPAAPAAAAIAAAPAPVPAPSRAASPPAAAPAAPTAAMPSSMPALAPLTAEEIEARAREWMDAATQAIAVKRGVPAAERLNQVLSLPPNSQTEAAQAMMGEAREYSGELSKARAEYETYLKLYPGGRHAEHVKQRLAGLNASLKQALASAAAGGGLQAPAAWTSFGSLSQYYYRGKSQIETITPPPPGQLVFNRDTLSLTDQHALISTLDLQARKRDAVSDTRIVLRDADTHNFLEGQRSYNRLNAAYVEQTDKELGYFVRAGRQNGSGGGIFGRFDGLWLGYNTAPAWRINGAAGSNVEFDSQFKRKFVSASLDYTAPPGRPGFSAYYIAQTLEGFDDRSAVGAEVRYFDPHVTVYGTVDYDLLFKSLNIAFVQANWRTDKGTNYFANIDYRKSPPFSLLTALPGQISLDPTMPTLDFRELLFTSVSTLGVEELRRQAAILTSNSTLFAVGFTHPFFEHWQLGADYRYATLSGTGASGILPAQPGTGDNHVISGQALGNSLLFANDTTVLNTSFILAPTYTGQSYNLTYVVPKGEWRVDANLRYYTQKDDQEQRQTRFSPSLKLGYRVRNSVTFELEGGNEYVDEKGPIRETHSTRWYIYGGYRVDFN
jgi:hypothetical protein